MNKTQMQEKKQELLLSLNKEYDDFKDRLTNDLPAGVALLGIGAAGLVNTVVGTGLSSTFSIVAAVAGFWILRKVGKKISKACKDNAELNVETMFSMASKISKLKNELTEENRLPNIQNIKNRPIKNRPIEKDSILNKNRRLPAPRRF